jgi:serine/threonine protein kinase
LSFNFRLLSLALTQIRANNILIDGKGRVKVADYGVFHILEAAMRSRTTYPGARLWPAPEVSGRARSGAYTTASETWAVGIVAMELVEGRPSVQRMYQASLARSRPAGTSATAASAAISTATPAFRDPTRWSPALRDFILSACRVAPAQRATAASLLSSRFIALADGGALAQAVAQAAALPTPARLQTAYDPADVAAKLHRRNNCVRAPLVLLDDLHAEDFIDPDLRADAADKPAVELALRAALRNRARADAVGLGRGPEDLGGAAADAATRRLEVFLDTIDMSTRRTR